MIGQKNLRVAKNDLIGDKAKIAPLGKDRNATLTALFIPSVSTRLHPEAKQNPFMRPKDNRVLPIKGIV